ncbi:putative F-box/LRR-repeat protein [Spatholobus suberectus]|nr:putative F-box/LRR-repeat protein [Spatholobus suberectus]
MDMFSLLSEPLLIAIASFLPFKEAARTCILSKQWKKIWQSTRNIEFNELFFVKPGGESEETKEAQRRVFLNYITHFVENYKGNVVDKFSLKVSNPQSCADTVERCVDFATRRGVKELRLDFSDPTWEENDFNNRDALFQLPYHVYGHAPLEALELNACGFAMQPDLVNFVALKDISLGWIEVRIPTVKTLLSTCRNLENLSLKKCWNLAHFDMGGEELGLRRLLIDNCHFVDADYVDFTAPNLTFLKYSGIMGSFQINVSPYVMQEAELDFTLMPHFDECGDALCQLLRDLSCVYVLTVCSFLLQAIPSGEEPARIQCDMNHYIAPYPLDFKKFWKEHCVMFECLRRTLKVVEVKGFRGSRNEVEACCYLIQAGCVLEQIIINVVKKEADEKLEKRYANARWLLKVPKASRNLQISIV